MADVAALETFVAVARLGSVVRAALRLGRTQPSLSARLAALEADWGVKLFRRHARGMALTPEGAELLGLAEAALQSLAAVDTAAGRPSAGELEIRVGSGDALGRELLPRALASLKREQPALAVRVLEGATPRLLDALRAGEVDLALVTGPPGNFAGERGLTYELLFASPVVLLTRRGSGSLRAATPKALQGRPIVSLQRGSGFRRHLEVAFAASNVPFTPAVEVGNLSLVRRFVAAGLGMAPVPAIAFPAGGKSAGVERRALRDIEPIAYGVASRAGMPRSETAHRFLELLRNQRV
jgi:DNA-binding transcriptional LysR family regulator